MTTEQQGFIEMLMPFIQQVNSEIVQQRTGIYEIYETYKQSQDLPASQKDLIYKYLKFYRCDVSIDASGFVLSDDHFRSLLKKADIVPRKLVLAQAAIESDWGKSRFALEGNNYFGIRCSSPGCGITPYNATSNDFMVKSYPSLLDGVRDYMRLLNSSKYYTEFRDLRIVNRLNSEMPDPFYVVEGLDKFSVHRQAYINSLISIMKNNFYQF